MLFVGIALCTFKVGKCGRYYSWAFAKKKVSRTKEDINISLVGSKKLNRDDFAGRIFFPFTPLLSLSSLPFRTWHV